jgi:hypothetical protein
MAAMNWLNGASDVATITLAIVGIGAYGWYQIDLYGRRRRLEKFLKDEVKGKRHKDDPGRRTVLFLASAMRMTEAEVLEAGFKSKKLKCVPGFDKETHRADVIYFEYDREQAS